MAQDKYITAEEAAPILNCSVRHVYRYGHAGKLQTKQVGRRIFFSRDHVMTLARTLQAPPPTKADLMPPGEFLNHIKDLEGQLTRAMLEVGRLTARLEAQQHHLTDANATRTWLEEVAQKYQEMEQDHQALPRWGDRLPRWIKWLYRHDRHESCRS
jgi:excisionase family DNA binding protein